MFDLFRYQTADGHEPFTDWLNSLRDRQAKARILARLERLEVGNFGDCEPCREGVSELRIHWGPGYRVYHARVGKTVSCFWREATSVPRMPTSPGRWVICRTSRGGRNEQTQGRGVTPH